METEINVVSYPSNDHYTETAELTSECPICCTTIYPVILHSVIIDDTDKVYALNHCPHCKECFLSIHIRDGIKGTFYFESSAPIKYNVLDFSDDLRNLSPDFISIYSESQYAEKLGLLSICGVGYRKALEFLVKDYAIHCHMDQKDIIETLSLSACIQKYIKDKELKTLAMAATWLGNDETHYIRKHPDYDLKKLKAFIHVFVTHIESKLVFECASNLLKA